MSTNIQPMPDGSAGALTVPLIARIYLKLGTWKWALSSGLDEDSIQGNYSCDSEQIVSSFPLNLPSLDIHFTATIF